MNLTQIVPNLPPAIDGIGDYAYTLAQQLLKRYGVQSHFLMGNPDVEAVPTTKGTDFPTTKLANRTPFCLIESIPRKTEILLLHYSDYPYEPRLGSPFWLLRGLAQLKASTGIKIAVMFHEFPHFYLRKNLYLLPLQYRVAQGLAQVADVTATNNAATADQIARLLKPPIPTIPVFSNIGEPSSILPGRQRQPWLVVFGTAGRRARIYQRSRASLGYICDALKIKDILDIGTPLDPEFNQVDGIALHPMGRLPADRVSQLMAQSLAGMAYSKDNFRLAKSGVFAAYCAHGLVPIVTSSRSSPQDGLFEGKHFLFSSTPKSGINRDRIDAIAQNANRWYHRHSISKNVDLFYCLLTHPCDAEKIQATVMAH